MIEHDHAGGEGGLHRRPLGRTAAAQEAAAEFHVPLAGRKGSRKAGGRENREEARPVGAASAAGPRSCAARSLPRSLLTHSPAGWPAGPVSFALRAF